MRKAELPSLTGLRFVAAFSVLFAHALDWCTPFSDSQLVHGLAGSVSVYGMPLFFVLSGFVIHYNYASLFQEARYGIATRDFLAARFARIYPLYFCFFIFGAVGDFTANWIADTPRIFLSYFVHSATLTQSWVYKIVVNHRLLLANGFGLGWSVSTEFFFYLAYIFLVFAILRLRRPSTAAIATVAYSAVVICGLYLAFLHSDALMTYARDHLRTFISRDENYANSFYRYLFYYSPYTRIWEFVLGCLTAHLFVLTQDRPATNAERRCGAFVIYGALLLLAAFGLLYGFDHAPGPVHDIIGFFGLNFGCACPIAIVIFCTARYRSAITTLLSRSWMVRLGDISYSIYAVHTWTLRPLVRPAIEFNVIFALDAILRLTAGVVFTIIVATATYAIIEEPCRRYLRGKLMRRPSKPDVVEIKSEPTAGGGRVAHGVAAGLGGPAASNRESPARPL